MLGILVADIQVILYVYQFHFFLFFILVSRIFIIIHEIGNQIIIISYLRDIVHCHSIQLILFQHPEFVTSSGTSDFVCLSLFFQDFCSRFLMYFINFHKNANATI